MLPVTEIFYTIQAEGSRIGVPSVFIRTSLCNFKCSGFKCQYSVNGQEKMGCDSWYAVDPAFKKEWDYIENYKDLVNKIQNAIPTFSKHNNIKPDIVFTGGEPTLHWKEEVFQRTIDYFSSRGHRITIETNGSLDINLTRKYHKDIMFSISVKLSNSGEPEHKRINIDHLTNILENTNNSYLKFVVSKDSWNDIESEINSLLHQIPIYVDQVYLMPMGETKEKVEINERFVWEKAMELGFRYSPRVHINIFSDEKGK